MKKFSEIRLLELTAIIAVVTGAYAALTLGQATIHTDTATVNRIFKSVAANKTWYPLSWNFNNGELYSYSTMSVGVLIQALISNPIISRVVTSAVVVLLGCAGVVWLSKSVFHDKTYALALPIIFILMCSDNYRDMFYFQAAYTLQLVTVTFCFGMGYKLLVERDNKKRYIIIHSLLIFIMLVGGIRSLAEYVLPLLSAVALYYLSELKNKEWTTVKSDILKIILLIGLPALIGIIVYKYEYALHESHMYSTKLASLGLLSSFSEFIYNIKQSFINLFTIFGYTADGIIIKNIIAIPVSIIILFVIPVLQLIDYKNLNQAEKAYVVFGWIHNIILFGAIILTSKLYERYLLSSLFIAAIMTGNYVCKRILLRSGTLGRIVSVAVFTLTIFYSGIFLMSTIGWREMVSAQQEVCQTLLDKGITKVYASSWVAYPYEIYSDNKLTAAAVSVMPRSLQKWYSLADDSSFEAIDGRSCVIMTQEEADTCSAAVYNMAGMQDEDFVIEDAYVSDNGNYYKTDLVVYVFNRDIADDIPEGFRDGRLDIKEMDFNWYGTITEDAIILEKEGVVHGPYAYLNAGHYFVSIEGNNLVGCNCAVASELSQDSIYSVTTDVQETHIDMDVTVFSGVEDAQIYLANYMDDKTSEFYDVLIEKID